MARIMAMDYGLKRTGIAVSDNLQIIATPLQTVDTALLTLFLTNYFLKEAVEQVIIGLPIDLLGNNTHGTAPVQKFIDHFKKQYPSIPISTIDERYTSKMAMQTQVAKGVSKKARANKSDIDLISAVILLQDFMARK
jgi:putative Holliday junction resolvase